MKEGKPPLPPPSGLDDSRETEGGGGGGPPLQTLWFIQGRQTVLPQKSATEYSTADAVKTTHRRANRRALSRIAKSRTNRRTRRRAKRATDQGVTHYIPIIAIIGGIASSRRIIGRLSVVGSIGPMMCHYRSLVMVNMFFHISMTGPMMRAISMMGASVMFIVMAISMMAV